MRKTILQLETEIAEVLVARDAWRAQADKATDTLKTERQQNADALIKVAQQVAAKDKDIAALKAELFQAHQNIATMKGYIARTLEDDAMRELGPVEVKPGSPNNYPEGPQSRRGGFMPLYSQGDELYRGSGYGSDKPKPWHDR